MTTSPFIERSWTFVDFFFVLSGFVIAAAYGHRLAEGYSPVRFLLLRLGRVWPLHLFIVAVLVAPHLAGLIAGRAPWLAGQPFAPPHSFHDLVMSVFLQNVWQVRFENAWNPQGWSISAELYAYLLAVAVFRFGRSRAYWAFLILAAGSLYVQELTLLPVGADPLSRCFLGFSLGALMYSIVGHGPRPARLSIRWTILEALACLAVFLSIALEQVPFPAMDGPFALAVLVFGWQRGWISHALGRKVPVLLGTLSYGIYMAHMLVMRAAQRALDLAESQVLHTSTPHSPLFWDGFALAVLLASIAAAWPCHRFVERPAREWSRRKVKASEVRSPRALPQAAA